MARSDNISRSEYVMVHVWVANTYGRPQRCEHCGTTENRAYQWSNISGAYTRQRDDWLRLCVPCHKKNDIKALGGKIKARAKKLQPTKMCLMCQTEFAKSPKLSAAQWLQTLLCSQACSGLYYRKTHRPAVRHKACAGCSTRFYKQKYVSMNDWAKRQYCGRKCGAAASATARLGVKQSAETRALKSSRQFERYTDNPELRKQISQKLRGNRNAARKANDV